jgi:hypothetical protein
MAGGRPEIEMRLSGANHERWELVKGRIKARTTRFDGDCVWALFVAERGVTTERLYEVRTLLDAVEIDVVEFALPDGVEGDWVGYARAIIDAANVDLSR